MKRILTIFILTLFVITIVDFLLADSRNAKGGVILVAKNEKPPIPMPTPTPTVLD